MDMLHVIDIGVHTDTHLVECSFVSIEMVGTHGGEGRLKLGQALDVGAGSRMLFVVEDDSSVKINNWNNAALESSLSDRLFCPLLTGDCKFITLVPREAFDSGNKVGGDSLWNGLVSLPQGRVEPI
jgi:hypothetical protein